MAGVLLPQVLIQATDSNVNAISGAAYYFYLTGTTTPANVYAASDLVTPLANPVVADSAGRLSNVYLDPDVTYRLKIFTAAGGTLIRDIDPVNTLFLQADFSNVENAAAAREALGIPAYVYVPATGTENSAAIQAAVVAAGVGGTVFLGDGEHVALPGVISLLSGQTFRGASKTSTTLTVSGPLSSSKSLVRFNSKTNVTISDITFDGDATVLLNRVTAMAGALTVSVESGRQYKVSMRGTLASTLTLSGPIAFATPSTSLVMTGTGMDSGTTIVYAYVTATAGGTMTMTPSGTINYVTVMENGAPLSGLLSGNATDGITLRDVMVNNFDTFGLSTNACDNLDIHAEMTRSAPSFEQNLCCLGSDQAGYHGRTIVRAGSRFVNSGNTSSCEGLVIEDGVFCEQAGYSSCWTTLGDSTNSRIGKMLYGQGNCNWPDMDNTVPNIHELYGSGEIIAPNIDGNTGAGLYVAGNWRIVEPSIYNTCSYWAANSVFTIGGLEFGYLSSTINSSGAILEGGVFGDSRSGTDRTQGYGITVQETSPGVSNVFGVSIRAPNCINNRTGRINLSNATSMLFVGQRTTFPFSITSTGSVSTGRSYTESVTATGTKAGYRAAGFSLTSGTLNGLIPVQNAPAADVAPISFINLTGGSVTGTLLVGTVEVEENPAD